MGEIHSLPKETTTKDFQDNILIVDKDHPKWNFIPWFKEKTIAIVDALKELMELLEQNLSKLNLKLTTPPIIMLYNMVNEEKTVSTTFHREVKSIKKV